MIFVHRGLQSPRRRQKYRRKFERPRGRGKSADRGRERRPAEPALAKRTIVVDRNDSSPRTGRKGYQRKRAQTHGTPRRSPLKELGDLVGQGLIHRQAVTNGGVQTLRVFLGRGPTIKEGRGVMVPRLDERDSLREGINHRKTGQAKGETDPTKILRWGKKRKKTNSVRGLCFPGSQGRSVERCVKKRCQP